MRCKFEGYTPRKPHGPVVDERLVICQKCADGLDRLAVDLAQVSSDSYR